MQGKLEAIEAQLLDFVSREVLGGKTAVTIDTPLADVGVDSFALMEVVLFLERQWGAVLAVEHLTRENTKTVRSLTDCVTKVSAPAR